MGHVCLSLSLLLPQITPDLEFYAFMGVVSRVYISKTVKKKCLYFASVGY